MEVTIPVLLQLWNPGQQDGAREPLLSDESSPAIASGRPFPCVTGPLPSAVPGDKQEGTYSSLTSLWAERGDVQREKKMASLASGVTQRELVPCSSERVCAVHLRP